MQKSKNYFRRQELLKNLEVPTMSTVVDELGDQLSKVVFQECPNALKSSLGLQPKLKGPGPVLWTSPSDLLIGKVCLKPPLTDKHIKALTHEGIIAIGNDIELKFWNEMELEKKKALEKQADYLRTIAERVQRVAVKVARNEEKAECARQFEMVSKEFEEKLKYELDRLEQDMLDHQQSMVRAAIAAVEVEWRLKLEKSIETTVQQLTKRFLDDLEQQKKQLEKVFRREFELQNGEYECAIQAQRDACATTMKQLRHCLECKNLANLMYILCMERRKCCIERSVLEYKYKIKIQGLNETIKEKDDTIKNLNDECDKRQRQLDIREQCVLEILKQFQKFINYALKATPTQAEFLLNVKKMMLFELTQTMIKGNKDNAPHLARTILPWKSDIESSSIDSESSKLTLPDYHECLDEFKQNPESDFLASFNYNDKLYVSQDLRIIAAKDMDISKTNILWNKDVEHMIKILKTSVDKGTTTKEDGETKSLSSGEISEEEISNEYMQTIKLEENKSEREKSIKSTLSFERLSRKSTLKTSTEKIDQALIYCNISGSKDAKHTESKDTTELLKKILRTSAEVEIAPIDTTGLLATKDSLIKIRESRRSSMRSFALDEVETGNMLMAVKESLQTKLCETAKATAGEGSVNFENIDVIRIPDEIEIKKTSKSSKVSIHKHGKTSAGLIKESILHDSKGASSPKANTSRESKLLSVKDSLIIHRTSIIPTAIPVPLRRKSMLAEDQIRISNSGSGRRASTMSKLSVTRDSLELIRKQSAISKISKGRSSTSPITLAEVQPKVEERVDLTECENPDRASAFVTTHVELAKIPTVVAETSVNFSPIKEVYEVNLMKTSDSPWKIYEPPEKEPSRDNFLTKPNEVKIAGEPQSKEHLHGSPSFTINRVHSILKILKEDSSLMRLFTSCTK